MDEDELMESRAKMDSELVTEGKAHVLAGTLIWSRPQIVRSFFQSLSFSGYLNI